MNNLFHQILFDKHLFENSSFTCSELLSHLMASNSTRDTFSSLSLSSELLFFLASACEADPKQMDYHQQELILNCFNILNFAVLEAKDCASLLNERFTDMMIWFVKQKQFFSLPGIRVIHSFSGIPFAGTR